MPIVIYNVTRSDDLYDDTKDHDYSIYINQKHICDFKHRRDEGLGKCLILAGQSVIDNEIPNDSTPFVKPT